MRQLLLLFSLFAGGSNCKADDLKQLDFAAGIKSATSSTPQNKCAFPDLKLPEEFAVYATGAYSGKKVSFQIDQSGHEGTQIDVTANSPERPVVLLLGAYEPTIWNIKWSEKTKILAVLVTGYHRQVIAGLDKATPVTISTYDNHGACGHFYVSADNLYPLNPLSKRVFGRQVDMVYLAENGSVVVGNPVLEKTTLLTSNDVSPESFRDKSAPKAGAAGLADAVRSGLLRKATLADADAWSAALAQNSPNRDIPPIAGQGTPKPPRPSTLNAYVVLKKFVYPSGLYGAHAATFLILKGVPMPEGNFGHSAVYDFNTLRCQGPLCSAR